MVLAVLAARLFLAQRQALRAAVAVHAVVHQRVAGVEEVLDRGQAVPFFALADVVPRVDQVVDDGRGVRPHLEQVVALEEAVVPIGGVGDHQGLHGHGVLFHQVGDAGVGVDDDLVRQAHVAAAVVLLGGDELLAVGPVAVDDRHAHRGIGVHHLLGRDDLELVGVGVQVVAARHAGDLAVVALDQLEGPVRRAGQRFSFPGVHTVPLSFLNRSRNTG